MMKRSPERGLFSWYRIFSVFWLVVIALQWIDFTEPIWLKQTTSITSATLLTVAAVEMLPLRAVWRWLLKAVIVLFVWRIVLVGYGVYVPEGRFFPDQLQGMAQHFTPYIWFSLSTWALFEIALELLTSKKRVLLFLAADLVAFAILDSFTPYYLWQNVAWTVFAGLGWLVSLHFRVFQLKYPHGWNRLWRQPLKIGANILAIFACVLLLGVNMPTVSPVLTDPYTAWKNRTGGSGGGVVPAAASVGGTVTFLAQDEVISGYSRDDTELGGGFEFSYGLVMTVDTSVRSYWRGETRRNYSGKGWSDGEEEGRQYDIYEGPSTGEVLMPEDTPDPGKLETMRVEQTITMQNEEVYPVLFGGYSIGGAEILDEDFENSATMMWAPKEAELHWSPVMELASSSYEPDRRLYPQKYKVVANIPLIPLEEVRAASFDELYAGAETNEYLQIPRNFPERVSELARQVTAEGDTPYAKMELLQAYLRQNFEYTNKPDLSRKESEDFVDGFLFEIKQGYCDYFSTSMVMMARSLGVPARWVKGYAPGTQPNYENMQRFGEMDTAYRVNNADAHSWAELYFGDYGWIPFEATPGFDAPVMYEQEDGSIVTSVDLTQSGGGAAAEDAGLLDWISPKALRIISFSALAILAAWAVYRLRSALYYGFYRLRLGRPLTLSEKAVLETQRLLRRLRHRGYSRSGDETLREAFARWKLEKPELQAALDGLLREIERASYSPQAFSESQWRIVRELTRKLNLQTRKRTKWRFAGRI
ncbi:transglutaminase domain-containing protein [Paenibacillus sp. M1]|uniref:Transglutaminase domain-containing protein n=1 Tax=Paenibacillus haidiansis TaxID=1574488 RepID=A0ABU7VMA0_9BACL